MRQLKDVKIGALIESTPLLLSVLSLFLWEKIFTLSVYVFVDALPKNFEQS